MSDCTFVSDTHGSVDRCNKLFEYLTEEQPGALFIGGDILPSAFHSKVAYPTGEGDFIEDYLLPRFAELRRALGDCYPAVFIILGNDDPCVFEQKIRLGEEKRLWKYVHAVCGDYCHFPVCGYSFVPPTPFQLKDWERYDVSRYVDPGSVSPEEGFRTRDVEPSVLRYQTIHSDLERLAGDRDISNGIFLFHSPPYQTNLDRADLDGRMVDYVQLDVNVGSIAIRRFIEQRQPLLTLHGHVHESARITGAWRDRIGRTHLFGAAHDGPELALVRFDLSDLEHAERVLL